MYADNGGGKSSTYISIANWYLSTGSDRKIWLFDTHSQWQACGDVELASVVNVIPLDTEDYGSWEDKAKEVRRQLHPDDWVVVDMMTSAWEGAQRWYWGQKSGNDSLAELWLKYAATDIAGDHGKNWGIINKFYAEFRDVVFNVPCHVLFTATAKPIREPNKQGKGGDDLKTRSFYSKTEMQIEGQKGLRGDCFTVIYAFEANGTYRYTTVKEMGPIGRAKRRMLLNEDVTDKGFVGGYLIPVAGWRP